ncbi:DUF3813 domain-containing protein [Bacillus tianshenii]|nr:DUF3813 domain-containing protein [Bacillus tianshenii]
MSNKLFQLAEEAVHRAEQAVQQPQSDAETQQALATAKNNLSSAFAQSSNAERAQLRELQQKLDQAASSIKH